MKVSVLPSASDELRETAKFYSERADQALGMAFIAEFERARICCRTTRSLVQSGAALLAASPYAAFHTISCIKSNPMNSESLHWHINAGDRVIGESEAESAIHIH